MGSRKIIHMKKGVMQSYSEGPYVKILILLTILGLILRLYRLGDVSLWTDEAITFYRSQSTLMDLWYELSSSRNPPLFFLIERFSLKFGSSEFLLRLAPAIIGTITIPITYYFGKEFFNRDIGIITACIVTFSTFHIYYSQEARAFSLLLFLTVIAITFYLKALHTDFASYWLLFGFFMGMACWAHYYALILLPPLLVWIIISRIGSPIHHSISRPLVVSGLTFFVVVSPLILFIVTSFKGKIIETVTWGFQGPNLIIETINSFFGVFNYLGYHSGNYFSVYLFVFIFFLGLFQLLQFDKNKFLFLIFTITIPFILGYYFSYWISTAPRYLIILSVFFQIGIAFFFLPFKKYTSTTRFLCIVVVIIMILSAPSLNDYYSQNSKWGHDWRDISNEIKNHANPGDSIVILPNFLNKPFRYYYNSESYGVTVFEASTIEDIERIVTDQNNNNIFFISANRRSEPFTWIDTRSKLIKEYSNYLFIHQLEQR